MGAQIAMVAWMLAIGLSVAALVITAAARPGNVEMAYAHLAIAGGTNIFFALTAIRELGASALAGDGRRVLAAKSARYMGLVWTWAALVIFVTYGTGVLNWKEWPAHLVGMVGVAGVCLAIARVLDKPGAKGDSDNDELLLTLVRYLAIAQLVGMVALMIGFMIDGQMKRFLVERFTDWPAKNVMFFGAMALAAISGAALKLIPSRSTTL
jgi:hypothetical protein